MFGNIPERNKLDNLRISYTGGTLMIVTEIINIDGRELTRAYSDAGYYIERDGAMYSEAVDPINSGREYTETDQPIETETQEVLVQE